MKTPLYSDSESIQIHHTQLYLSQPIDLKVQWQGDREPLSQLLCAWHKSDEDDRPMHPQLIGKPGTGKTTLAAVAAQSFQQPFYIFQCTADTRPEDLIITPIIQADGTFKYQASAITTALLKGGIVLLDEANRMSEKSWASLAPLLDQRAYLDATMLGTRFFAESKFRLCITTNDDSSCFDLPDYIQSRLSPKIYLDYPSEEELCQIIKQELPQSSEEMRAYISTFIRTCNDKGLDYSPRDALNLTNYSLKQMDMYKQKNFTPNIMSLSVRLSLGTEALIHLQDPQHEV